MFTYWANLNVQIPCIRENSPDIEQATIFSQVMLMQIFKLSYIIGEKCLQNELLYELLNTNKLPFSSLAKNILRFTSKFLKRSWPHNLVEFTMKNPPATPF